MRLIQSHETTWDVQAPAKLNLTLQILRKRSDGYHDIESVMVTVGNYDELRFEATEGEILLECQEISPRRHWGGLPSQDIPADERNLVVRAARLLKEYALFPGGVRILLRKRIPAAAGLAGGSSDCAATLVALNALWGLSLSRKVLAELASRLGSDISFFLSEHAVAVCTGRGTEVSPQAVAARPWFVIVRPPSGLSTADVYRDCRIDAVPGSTRDLLEALSSGAYHLAAHTLLNGLQPPAIALNADVQALQRMFDELPFVTHQMSGSGTAYFGWCRSRRQAMHLAARLRARGLGAVTVATIQP